MTQRIIDGAELFAQVCRTYDEFIGLDDLAELMDKMPTVEAISVDWIRELQTKYLEAECYMSVCVVNEILNLWRKENDTENN